MQILGYVIMDGEQLGYSNLYSYFSTSAEVCEEMVAEVAEEAPNLKVRRATLLVEETECKQ